jgi:hypothetical protein
MWMLGDPTDEVHQSAYRYRILQVTIIAKIQTLSIENICDDGGIVRCRMWMRITYTNIQVLSA